MQVLAGGGQGAHQHCDLGRHRRGQNNLYEHPLQFYPGDGAHRHYRRCRRAAACSSIDDVVRASKPVPPNVEGQVARSVKDNCSVNSLRMRPDHESSSAKSAVEEAFDMLQAMNTGHEGSMTTIHAGTPRGTPFPEARIDGCHGQREECRRDPSASRSRRQVSVIVQVSRMSDGNARKVTTTSRKSPALKKMSSACTAYSGFVRKGIGPDGKVPRLVPAERHPPEVSRKAAGCRYPAARGNI